MQAEPAEIRLNVSSQGPLRTRSSVANSRVSTSDVAPLAIDEAFAALSDSTNRVDSLRPKTTDDKKDAGEMIRKNQALVASMVSQLETLDRQRQQLADLLDAVEIDSLSE